MDHKKAPDYDPNQKSEICEDSEDAESWIDADKKVAAEHLRLRMCERLDIPKVRDPDVVCPEDYDNPEITRMQIVEFASKFVR